MESLKNTTAFNSSDPVSPAALPPSIETTNGTSNELTRSHDHRKIQSEDILSKAPENVDDSANTVHEIKFKDGLFSAK